MPPPFGKYRLDRRLGAGGMGEVWEAFDTVLGRAVAVKLLTGDGADAAQSVREAAAAARVNHPNAVAVYDAAESGGRWGIVMELVTGPSAAKLVADKGRLGWVEATRIARDAAAGLAAVHAAGLVHRDVKPANILLTPDGTAKVGDFGLARPSARTTVTTLVGTPLYMSPEQCWNELADARADVYSLGATYFTLLTARPPFPGDSEMAVMYAHCHSPVPDPQSVAADVPAGCGAVVRRAMAKAPADRFASADELRAALDDLLAGATVPVRDQPTKTIRLPPNTTILQPLPVPLPASPRKPFPTRRVAVAAAAGSLAAAAFAAFSCWPKAQVSPPPTAARLPTDDGPDWGTFPPFNGEVEQIAISPDGRTVAVTVNRQEQGGNGNVTGDLHLLTRDGKPLPGWPKPVGAAEGVAFTPDGRAVAAAFRSDGEVRLYTVADGKPVPVTKAELRAASVVQFSDDGEWMAAAGFTDAGVVVRFWQREGDRRWVFRHDGSAPEHSIWGFRFAPGRTVVALAAGVGPVDTKQATVRLFDAPTGREVKQIPLKREHLGPTVAFAANAPLMAVSSFGEVRLFRVPEWEEVGDPMKVEYGGLEKDLSALAVSPDGKWVAGGRDVHIHLWRTDEPATIPPIGNWAVKGDTWHSRTVTTLAFTPDGKRLLSGGNDGKVIVHDHADLFGNPPKGKP